MIRTTLFAIAVNMLLAAPGAFACDYPRRASIADGATATKDEMIVSQKSVKKYMAAMDEYLTCLETEEADTVAGLDSPEISDLQQRESILAKKYNAAIAEMEIIAAEFNVQVRAYKERAK